MNLKQSNTKNIIQSYSQPVKANDKGKIFPKTKRDTLYIQGINNRNDSWLLIRNNASQKKLETFLKKERRRKGGNQEIVPGENNLQKTLLGKQKLREFVTRFSL